MTQNSKKMNESTPLAKNESGKTSSASASGNGLETVSSFAQSVFTKENLESMGRVAKEQAIELRNQAQYGDNSLRVLALLGGVALIAISGYEIFGALIRFNIIGALIEIYTLLIGIVVVILEGGNSLLSTRFVGRIHKYALFLKFLWGRGCLYFICGTLQLYQLDFLNIICGVYMCCIGILFVIVGQRTAYKLRTLRKSLYSEQTLHQKFAMADLDGDNGLNVQQFRNLTMSLGLDLTRRETEAAFHHIHKSQSEKLTFEEFHQWWTKTDAEQEIDENAFVFV